MGQKTGLVARDIGFLLTLCLVLVQNLGDWCRRVYFHSIDPKNKGKTELVKVVTGNSFPPITYYFRQSHNVTKRNQQGHQIDNELKLTLSDFTLFSSRVYGLGYRKLGRI